MTGVNEFDLTTKDGRRRARRAGVSVPAKKSGRAPRDFWSFVKITDGCWEWTGGTKDGYGDFRDNIRAHRWSWMETHGPIPDGLVLCHQCDNRLCVRPDHLFLGTLADNVADRVVKNRSARGERVNTAKLTRAQVVDIRRRAVRGRPGRGAYQPNCPAALAREYGVNIATIIAAIKGESWK